MLVSISFEGRELTYCCENDVAIHPAPLLRIVKVNFIHVPGNRWQCSQCKRGACPDLTQFVFVEHPTYSYRLYYNTHHPLRARKYIQLEHLTATDTQGLYCAIWWTDITPFHRHAPSSRRNEIQYLLLYSRTPTIDKNEKKCCGGWVWQIRSPIWKEKVEHAENRIV